MLFILHDNAGWLRAWDVGGRGATGSLMGQWPIPGQHRQWEGIDVTVPEGQMDHFHAEVALGRDTPPELWTLAFELGDVRLTTTEANLLPRKASGSWSEAPQLTGEGFPPCAKT